MIDGRLYAQRAVMWHWYLPLCTYLNIFVDFVLFQSVLLLLLLHFVFLLLFFMLKISGIGKI